MAITEGNILEIAVKQASFSQTIMNVFNYEVTGTFTGISAGAVGNAWWQAVKASYRGIIASPYANYFQEVSVRVIDTPTGDYGVYSVPSGEKDGTRSYAGTDYQPTFLAVGARLTVDTRVTRPGQKRFGGLMEGDVSNSVLAGAVITAVEGFLDVACVGTLTLGSPALGMDLLPVVVRKNPDGTPNTYQAITGRVVNNYVTSQVSRKLGRGV